MNTENREWNTAASDPSHPKIRWTENLGENDTEENSVFPGMNTEGQPQLANVIYADMKENVGKNKSTLYIVQSINSGNKYTVWGTQVLDDRMKKVPVGSEIRITLLRTVKGNGPKPWKDFLVEFAKPVVVFESTENTAQPDAQVAQNNVHKF